jgi:hypothetical protein
MAWCKCGDYYDQIADWQKICKKCYAIDKQKQDGTYREWKPKQNSDFTSIKSDGCFLSNELVKKIRILVHPDKHNNSELSNNVSKEINALIKVSR